MFILFRHRPDYGGLVGRKFRFRKQFIIYRPTPIDDFLSLKQRSDESFWRSERFINAVTIETINKHIVALRTKRFPFTTRVYLYNFRRIVIAIPTPCAREVLISSCEHLWGGGVDCHAIRNKKRLIIIWTSSRD